MVDAASTEWVTVPGTGVSLQIQVGQPLAILRAWAADFNAYVEPLRDADSACWTPTNSVASSNHLSGTACDLNWNSHPFRVLNAGFGSSQITTIRELLQFYEDTVFWGNDWDEPRDAMHFQVGYNTYNNPHTADFIRRKIRPDGYSTFRRGGNIPAPAPVNDAAAVLTRAVSGLTESRAREILPAVRDGLLQSQCTNANRIAMWLAQIGHESGSFKYTEEIQSGDESTDRWLYKGRTWIQITWHSNYAAFSRWCFDKKLVPTPTYFADRPKELAELKWAGIGPAWYWTVARPDINTLSDRRDLVAVTQRINGGQNGIEDRRNRYNRALPLGDELLKLIGGEEDELANPEIERFIREIHAALFNQVESRCIYAPEDDRTWQLHELLKNTDGTVIDGRIEELARGGDSWALGLIVGAAAGRARNKEQRVINRARWVLAQIESTNPEILQAYLTGGQL